MAPPKRRTEANAEGLFREDGRTRHPLSDGLDGGRSCEGATGNYRSELEVNPKVRHAVGHGINTAAIRRNQGFAAQVHWLARVRTGEEREKPCGGVGTRQRL